ncbi:hypothetical protein [Trinickia mobilis]|uniref:hypothetical protein n=1 Tax=Trinickia mobilis TaxID=2816356 RepID=UPI001A8E8ED8|nr:hypothetical protein [Trinickia mobilis]
MLFEEALGNVFRRHRLLAEAVRCAVSVWADSQAIDFNIIEPNARCDTITAVLTNGHSKIIRDYAEKRCGVILADGIAELSGKVFRIAHMGMLLAAREASPFAAKRSNTIDDFWREYRPAPDCMRVRRMRHVASS